MDHLNRHLLSYGFDPAVFHTLMETTDAVFSGSGALALYLEQEGVDAGFVPGDMDIWLDGRGEDAEEVRERWGRELLSSGYTLAKEKRTQDSYLEYLTRIQRVMTWEKGQGQKHVVQLIVVSPSEEDSLYEYLMSSIDLSVCMTWWEPEKGRFCTMYPWLTRAKQMFIHRRGISVVNPAREESRLQKYEGRGFVVVDEPPPFWCVRDERKEEDLDVWRGIQAFDVWQYEEVDARDHVGKGDRAILLGCGGTWQAYDRRELVMYMEGTEQEGCYTTPYRQSVSKAGWELLMFTDHTVFCLVHPEVQGDKTMYGMEAYSVEAWRQGEPSHVVGKEREVVQEDDVPPLLDEPLPSLDDLMAEDEVLPAAVAAYPLAVAYPAVAYPAEDLPLILQMMEWLQEME